MLSVGLSSLANGLANKAERRSGFQGESCALAPSVAATNFPQ
jgi:hypothetical protein